MKTQRIFWFMGALLCATITGIAQNVAQNTSPYWSLQGNSNAAFTSKLGTTNQVPLRLFTNNAVRVYINATTGNVAIGNGNAASPYYRLYVKGAAYGIYGAGTSYGIVGAGGSYGVYGSGTYMGVRGVGGTYGTYGSGSDYGAVGIGGTYGVYGSGSDYGVYGNSTDGFGVEGYSANSYGLYGSGYDGSVAFGDNIGAYGSGSSFGLYGSGGTYGAYAYGSSYGVYGETYSGTAAGYFYSSTTNGIWAYNNGASPSNGYYGAVIESNVWNYGGYYGPSDKNLKKNIVNFEDAMSIINKLKPKNFEYRSDGKLASLNLPKGTHYGLIAQDLEQVLPNLVAKGPKVLDDAQHVINPAADLKKGTKQKAAVPDALSKEGVSYEGVNYIELIPLMIKGMQEQDEIIKRQQTQIDELKRMLSVTKEDASAAADLTGAWLKQNSPNPFRENTTVQFALPASASEAKLLVYDQNGRLVKSVSVGSGQNQVSITKGSLPSGNYVYTLMVNGKKVDSKNMIIAK